MSSVTYNNLHGSSVIMSSDNIMSHMVANNFIVNPTATTVAVAADNNNSANVAPIGAYDTNKKKKGPTSTVCVKEELCLVCGDRASGYHYNALTCEGCKGFFRRSITKNAVYQCKYGNSCDIDMYMRRKCQECRLKKCLNVGMRPECVIPEFPGKKEKKQQQQQQQKNNSNNTNNKDKPNSTSNISEGRIGNYDCSTTNKNDISAIGDTTSSTTTANNNTSSAAAKRNREAIAGLEETTKPISREQEELIHSLVYFQEQYEQPSDEDLQRVMRDVQSANEEGDMKFRQITEMTILTVQLIVEFAKNLPGFDKLLREDQITLLKACSSEVMMLRMARKYDIYTDSIVFANNEPYTKDSYNMAGMGETIDDLLRFCRQMCSMKVDNAEYALLTAIVIFSGRPSLIEGWKVEKIQEIYIETLKSYVDNRVRPNSATIFARLLSVLTELRTLGNQNSEMCFSLKLKRKVLPPFLSEIWDIVP